MSNASSKVDAFMNREKQWQDEFEQLRMIVLDCGLTEEFKWGTPCYTFQEKNIVLIHGFKEYCALLFFKGALLNDVHGLLVIQSENVQATKQIRFTSSQEITRKASVLKKYIYDAIEVEKAGLEVVFKKTSEFAVAEEFQAKLDAMPALKKAFEALTPGRQRGYLLYFAGAKQAKTRMLRVENCIPQILEGRGLKD
ncbi:MAG TPA: DUF1801 domain-containing protein [Chitinophaga sp.]|uniref:YdeI/OmpD-associated family protein n=1 Tax=Chitinophaga sp. TaxID=1869181 RepID=UPI002CA9673F|nr:DUF1801 domain-containing protein [Chitinophaga sp.]HVI45394.1 DUF1801 domain-containing protein [Chitinophaga sp.]